MTQFNVVRTALMEELAGQLGDKVVFNIICFGVVPLSAAKTALPEIRSDQLYFVTAEIDVRAA